MNSQNLLKNIMSSIILKIISLIYGFVIPILIIKTYGSEINGLVSSITNFLVYIVLLEAGIGPVVKNAFYKPLVEKNKDLIEKILGTSDRFFKKISYIFLIYIFILCIVYPLIVQDVYTKWYVISLILSISISRFSEYFIGMTYKMFLQSDGKNYVIDYIYAFTYVLDIIIIYLLISNNTSIQIIKLVCSLIYLIRPFFMKRYFDKHYIYKIDKKSKFPLEKKWDALFHHIAATVQDNIDVIVLTLFSTLSNVSIYSVYFLVTSGIRAIIYSFVNGLDAFFGKMMISEDNEIINKKFQLYNFAYYTISTILLSCTLVLIIPFIKIYTLNISDANYIYPLFGYLMVFAEFNFIIRYPFSTITFAKGHFKETRNFSVVEPVVNIILSIILVKNYGLIGVVIGTLVSVLIRSLGFIIYATKKILLEKLWNTCNIILLSFLEILTVLFVVIKFINFHILNYFDWFILAIIVFITITICITSINCLIYKNNTKQIFKILKNKIRRK